MMRKVNFRKRNIKTIKLQLIFCVLALVFSAAAGIINISIILEEGIGAIDTTGAALSGIMVVTVSILMFSAITELRNMKK